MPNIDELIERFMGPAADVMSAVVFFEIPSAAGCRSSCCGSRSARCS